MLNIPINVFIMYQQLLMIFLLREYIASTKKNSRRYFTQNFLDLNRRGRIY